MGIKFSCPACGHQLNVKPELAGKRGRCPKCQAKIDIPTEGATADVPASAPADAGTQSPGPGVTAANVPGSNAPNAPAGSAASSPVARVSGGTSVAGGASVAAVEEPTRAFFPPGDPIAEAPTLQWYAMPPGAANQYGPATGEEFRAWLQEGRIPADALVWRQDWPDWKRAASVFPQLWTPAAATPPAAPVPTAMPTPGPPPTPPAIVQAPVGQPPFPLPGAPPGTLPIAQTSAPDVEAFPVMPREPATSRTTAGRGRAYRPRSNTAPLIIIVVLLFALIPLGYLVWKVIHDQTALPPRSPATSTPAESAEESADDSPPADPDEPASSNESEE